jgi:hypothetical protein
VTAHQTPHRAQSRTNKKSPGKPGSSYYFYCLLLLFMYTYIDYFTKITCQDYVPVFYRDNLAIKPCLLPNLSGGSDDALDQHFCDVTNPYLMLHAYTGLLRLIFWPVRVEAYYNRFRVISPCSGSLANKIILMREWTFILPVAR